MDPLHLSPVEASLLFKETFHNAELTSILVLDLKGNIIDVNNGFLKTFGYSKDFLIGKNFSLLFIEEDKLRQLPENEVEEAINTGSSNDENYILDGDGSPRWVKGESILIEESVKRYIIKIVHDTHMQKLLEEELVKKNEEQGKTIKDRNLFIYTASHDLRSPIANITGLVNSLKESHDDPKELDLTIKMLDYSVERLKSKLNELAAIGKEQEELTEVEFQKALNDVLLDLEEEIKGSEAEIIADFSKAPLIYFSEKNLKSILQNLVSNSVRFRSPYRKPKVLVMAIVKRLVENAGGKIELQSKIGEGSTFEVFLPSTYY